MTTIKINFTGGIISPGNLYNILVAAGKAAVYQVKFGLRQQLLIETEQPEIICSELELLQIEYETASDDFPNIVSSYPAEEVFINNTWLSEGVYKDIFDQMEYRPRLKINVSDCNQSFTPLLTGNINWVASPQAQHFWHLFIRFPKTNSICQWKEMVYTNDVARMSGQIESLIFQHKKDFADNPAEAVDLLYKLISNESFITQPVTDPLPFPPFNLPYYEGLNRYNDKTWLGIYRRDEMFSVAFLKELCKLCLQTKIGQICSTPWKSLIIKSIEEKDRNLWTNLLSNYQINVRHGANELNFQVEDNCKEGLELKKYLVRYLSNDDMRTFGICFGVKTRKKSEVFSNILIRRKPLIRIGNFGLLYLYDILCANDFNPNERTGYAFSKNNLKIWLPEQLRRTILAFNNHQLKASAALKIKTATKKAAVANLEDEFTYQCQSCYTIYDQALGEPDIGIVAGTAFEQLPSDFCCPLCESPKEQFIKIGKSKLGLVAG